MADATLAARPLAAVPAVPVARGNALLQRAWRTLLVGLIALFLVNIGLMIAAVATNSFARRWLGTWLPQGWTTSWYVDA